MLMRNLNNMPWWKIYLPEYHKTSANYNGCYFSGKWFCQIALFLSDLIDAPLTPLQHNSAYLAPKSTLIVYRARCYQNRPRPVSLSLPSRLIENNSRLLPYCMKIAEKAQRQLWHLVEISACYKVNAKTSSEFFRIFRVLFTFTNYLHNHLTSNLTVWKSLQNLVAF